MPRKKATNGAQSSALHQPTLAGFINTKSASMANPTAKPQPTAKTASGPSTSTISTSKSLAKPTSTAKPKTGPPTSRRRSATKRKRTKSPKKKQKAPREESPSEGSGDDSSTGALQAIRFESEEEEAQTGGSTVEVTSSSEDEEDQVVSPPRPKRTPTQAKRKIRASSDSSDSDVEMIGGSAGAPRNGKRRLKKRLTSSDEEGATETNEEEVPSPKKRRLIKGLKPSTSEEEIDLMDEVDEHRECYPPSGTFYRNCADTVVGIIDSRLRTRDKKTAFQRSLETLKRALPHTQRNFLCLRQGAGQRSGLSVDSPGSSEAEEEEAEPLPLPLPGPSRVKYDFFKPFAGAKPSKGVMSDEEVEVEEEEEEEEGGENSWIVEDDGPESVPELPVAFNMSSHQGLSHHFKIICQLFVHLAVRSPSQRMSFMQDVKACEHMNIFQSSFHMISEFCHRPAEDSYFYAALSTVRRKLMGMRDSLITSSTWQTEFKRVLEKYPVLSMVQMDFAVPGCDACNLGARMSKVVGRVSGQPYDRSTFEVWGGFPGGGHAASMGSVS